MTEALYHLISDAHKSVMHHGRGVYANDGDRDPVPMIEEIVARLEAAKAAYLAGDRVEASRLFDPRYEVPAAVREASLDKPTAADLAARAALDSGDFDSEGPIGIAGFLSGRYV